MFHVMFESVYERVGFSPLLSTTFKALADAVQHVDTVKDDYPRVIFEVREVARSTPKEIKICIT